MGHVGECVWGLWGSVILRLWKCCGLCLRTCVSSLIHSSMNEGKAAFGIFPGLYYKATSSWRKQDQATTLQSLLSYYQAGSFLTGRNIQLCHIPPLGGDKEEGQVATESTQHPA